MKSMIKTMKLYVAMAAALLMENGIKVYSEQEIDEDLLKRLIAEDRG